MKDSDASLSFLEQQKKAFDQRFDHVSTVYVVLSAKGMANDFEALKKKIQHSYNGAKVFFHRVVSAEGFIEKTPKKFDLLIDFTAPGQREGFFEAYQFRKKARFAVGRNASRYRKKTYDRIFDETQANIDLPHELLAKERWVQNHVLFLAGVSSAQAGSIPEDISYSLAFI